MSKPDLVRLYRGYGDLAATIPLDKYTYVEFEVGDMKLKASADRGKLKIHADVLGETLSIIPMVANQILVGVSR